MGREIEIEIGDLEAMCDLMCGGVEEDDTTFIIYKIYYIEEEYIPSDYVDEDGYTDDYYDQWIEHEIVVKYVDDIKKYYEFCEQHKNDYKDYFYEEIEVE